MHRGLGVDWPGTVAPPVPPASEDDRAAVAQALRLLEDVPVEPEMRRGYDRDDWPHWSDADGDCLDARHEVLLAESLESVRLAPDGCSVFSGLWRAPFTGETATDPRALDVDHFVPLQEAHDSGGHAWDRARREAFANDLVDPHTLVAITADANRDKGAQGPEDWLPPDAGYRCRYVADWVAIKARWGLAMDERERVAVGNVLAACAGGGGEPRRRPRCPPPAARSPPRPTRR